MFKPLDRIIDIRQPEMIGWFQGPHSRAVGIVKFPGQRPRPCAFRYLCRPKRKPYRRRITADMRRRAALIGLTVKQYLEAIG